MNTERGDTFIIKNDSFRGSHFTTISVREDKFLAATTNGLVYRFENQEHDPNQLKVYRDTGSIWKYHSRIPVEAIIGE